MQNFRCSLQEILFLVLIKSGRYIVLKKLKDEYYFDLQRDKSVAFTRQEPNSLSLFNGHLVHPFKDTSEVCHWSILL